MEKMYQYVLIQMPNVLKCSNIGMGSVQTWHGTPDARVRGAEVVCRRAAEEEIGYHCYDSNTSDGATTTVEGKVLHKDANLQQAVGTCIVSSFIKKPPSSSKRTCTNYSY